MMDMWFQIPILVIFAVFGWHCLTSAFIFKRKVQKHDYRCLSGSLISYTSLEMLNRNQNQFNMVGLPLNPLSFLLAYPCSSFPNNWTMFSLKLNGANSCVCRYARMLMLTGYDLCTYAQKSMANLYRENYLQIFTSIFKPLRFCHSDLAAPPNQSVFA